MNKVDSKVRKFSDFHNEWNTDGGRDDENMKVITNKEENDLIQFLVKKPNKNPVD